MSANLYSRRVAVASADGWVRLADSGVVALHWIRAAEADTVAIRQAGSGTAIADAALLPAGVIGLNGVDAAEIEIATESETDVAVHVIGYTRR